MSHSSDPAEEVLEIPFWVGGHTKWISGIRSITTCGDILKALLKSESKYAHHTDVVLKFVLVERWRKVEKPLRSDSKIFKIYQAWGTEISDVKFVVKRLHSSSNRSSTSSSRIRRSDSKLWRQNRIGCSTDTIHPKCLSESEDESKPLNPRVEKLIKTILAQGESIQAELLRLTTAASTRGGNSGDDKDYLLQHYLGSIPERPEDSGCTSEEKSDSPQLRISRRGDDEEVREVDISFLTKEGEEEESEEVVDPGAIHLWTELFEKIFNMNQKLATQEEELNNLSRKMKSYLETPESFVELELQSASLELSQASELNSNLGREIRRNELALGNMAKTYDGRKVFANRLEIDVNRAESASIKLKKELADQPSTQQPLVSPRVSSIPEKTVRFNDRETILSTPEPSKNISASPVKKSILKDGTPLDPGADSNSDTGLSSMHSSSSEDGSSPVTTAYGLDTLV